ncbi:MAG: 2-C-methyl-D-erythritol 4-phosphate cytidylyltransferase [Acidimicrobiales bacterium]|nr:MAG: 2-C-methyl-D-erythritol 4-phosphate cytidylyltransferase [Acidimicrobiales bacterium]
MSGPNADCSGERGSNVWTVVVAGGSGLRFGEHKQFVDLVGKSVVQRSVEAAAAVSGGVVVAIPESFVSAFQLADIDGCAIEIVAGGSTRAESVRAGLRTVPDDAEVILVHDAARPMASPDLFGRVVAAVRSGNDAVVPAVPVTDTIRHRDGGVVDREMLLLVQTPQGFAANVLREAHATGADATDDASLVELIGRTVTVVDGEPENLKITNPTDLTAAEAVVRQREI